ncbi:50S ribosomal protein L30 [archaeon]|nr:MAG: 50S ribosomal protein L30 [archaeon]
MKTKKAEKTNKDANKLIAVVRIRGAFTMRKEVKDTLKMLRLNRKNHCVLVRGTDSIKGMLQKTKDYVTFGEISEETLKMMIAKRGRIGSMKLTAEQAETAVKEAVIDGKLKSIKPVFRLTPASGGFREIKQFFPRGELGYRGDKINELLEKMI